MRHVVEIYQDSNQEWRWRLRYAGSIVADSGEGYTRKRDCARALRGLGWRMITASVKVLP